MVSRIVQHKAFSLAEAMVAAVVFALAVAGIFASLASISKPVIDSTAQLNAALCGQQLLENLRLNVDARDWDTGSLKLSAGNLPNTVNVTNPNIALYYPACTNMYVAYTVSDAGNGSRARKVVASITY